MKPNHYLVKALQAAVALGGREIEFRLGLHSVKLDFKFGHQESVEAAALAEGLAGRDPASGHLAQALKTARELPSPKIRWSLDRDHSLTLEGDQIEVRSARVRGGVVRGRLKVWRHAPLEGHRKKVIRALEHRLLYQRGRFAPTPVVLDGREIERGWSRQVQPEGDWFDYLSYPYYLMEGYFHGSLPLPALEFPPVSLRGFTTEAEGLYLNAELEEREESWHFREGFPIPSTGLVAQPTLFKFFEGVSASPNRRLHELSCQVAFALPLKLTGAARVTFIFDGVTGAEKELDLGLPGLLCVASGEGLELDPNLHTVIENEAYRERISQLRRWAARFREKLATLQGRFKVLASDGHTRKAVGSRIYASEVRRGLEERLKI